jgi:6-pyruvoyltetrahydropterin/6-carboxytetrahydropterin synthase
MLLPTQSDLIRVAERGPGVEVRYRDRLWVFPREDCVLLPLANTTAELLARHLGGRLLERLRAEHAFEPAALRVEVEESFGQMATYHWRRG